jgi:hypothetical protein
MELRSLTLNARKQQNLNKLLNNVLTVTRQQTHQQQQRSQQIQQTIEVTQNRQKKNTLHYKHNR